MSKYSNKRRKSGLTASDMANKLGIDYVRYTLIEKGVVKMPKHLIDKFNEIVSKGKNVNVLENLDRKTIVEQWFDELTKEKLYDKMKDFNIETLKDLSRLMGYDTASNFSTYINHKELAKYNFKNRLYSFFENELNMQPVENKKYEKKEVRFYNGTYATNREIYERELWEGFTTIDLNNWMIIHGYSLRRFEIECGIGAGVIQKIFVRGDRELLKKTIDKIKEKIMSFDDYVVVDEKVEEKQEQTQLDIVIEPTVENTSIEEESGEQEEPKSMAEEMFKANITVDNLMSYVNDQITKIQLEINDNAEAIEILTKRIQFYSDETARLSIEMQKYQNVIDMIKEVNNNVNSSN